MKTKSKYGMIIGLIVSLLLLMTQCDKFTEVKYLTPNNFTLDASSHEFDVTTKQETSLNMITINGNVEPIIRSPKLFDIDTVIVYNNYSVTYKNFYEMKEWHAWPVEITGEWFKISKIDDAWGCSMHIFIDENTDDADRNLIINIWGPLIFASDINIKQQGKGK